MANLAKILILRFSSIGDIILTTPVVRCVKQQLPTAEVHYCTKRGFATLTENNPYIDKRYYLDKSLRVLIRALRAERYDYVIDLHNNLRTGLIKRALGVRSYSFDKLNWQKWLYVRFHINRMPEQHIVDRYMATVKPLGVTNDDQGLDYFIPANDQVSVQSLPQTHRHGYVAYAIGGQHATKRLPVARMIELCRQIDKPLVLLGGKEDRTVGDTVVQAVGEELVYNGCGLYTLNQSASLVQQAQVVFSHDTGLMHIAAALTKKVYAIWGNTVPEFGMYPYQTPHVNLQKEGLSCRPCSKIGFEKCPQGHFKCMQELPFTFDPGEL
ncbi:glycosyltransferase family 9 protein [Spirosoma sp. KUDC1026]|uniref:glycosyltransferase family 9 protein n=1 Tax=Spirosoma sp. KUDC1026 TaxID=2745947 RepID=UPI00159BC1F5|nr:glycosyltransferase family 9 protein [Spirosoma sp. KUDC1026]QKZ15427.1 glycosyltransferase family 9 protein [Spirosoma sp. KUDC1026]